MAANIERIKENVKITDIAGDLNLTLEKVGSYYTLQEHDSVRIEPRKNIFIQNSTGRAGSVIDFVMLFGNMKFKEAIDFLTGKKHLERKKSEKVKASTEEKKDFILPEKTNTMRNVFAYLIKSRGIEGSVVSEFVKRRNLYQDKRNNCVFVSYKENKPIFACLRGTDTKHRFLGDVSGSDYKYSFFIDNGAKKLIIIESVIDAMSVMTLYFMNGDKYMEFDYLALAGTQKWEEPIKTHLYKRGYEKVLLCLDNDAAGRLASEKIEKYISDIAPQITVKRVLPKKGKDYNEYLQIVRMERKGEE
ncbi:MAG: toprim domain-containing protein [Firmicutes bacterium]|nr:toprim domain-containing protein [Bacillota bacterium]